MQLEASWRISGIVSESRELKSPKNPAWRGWVCKVQSIGATFEVELTEESFKAVGVGQELVFSGRFDVRPMRLQLVATKITPPAQEAKR